MVATMAVTETLLGLPQVLREVSAEIEIARGPDGMWFGVFTMQPTSITDLAVRDLREWGLVEVLEWDEGPERCRVVVDLDSPSGFRRVRTRSRPSRARLSTDGWVLLDR